MTDQADPVFVNTLKINGFLNGVINLAFSTAKWHPALDVNTGQVVVRVDEPITVDLRMDLSTAISVRDALDKIIEANTKSPETVN